MKNSTTTTLAQSWASTQGRLVRVEVLVLFSALLWILVELLGSRRRRHNQGFFRFFVWAVYTLFTVLGPYTIGLLQDGPFRDQTFVLWATLLLLIQVSADSISVYSIQDIERRKSTLVQHVLQIVLVLWLILNCQGRKIRCYTATIWIVWVQSVILTYRKSGTLSNASKKEGLLKHSKVVADYMMAEHERIAPGSWNPFLLNPRTMEGYSYIFHGEEELASLLPPTTPECSRFELNEATRSGFHTLLKRGKVTVKYTTIDSVWRWIESQSVYTKEAMATMKDVALSFTLFKLLKRRLCGYRIGEAGLAKTLDFVLRGLMSEEEGSDCYARAFGVVEIELAFLYDFLYTGFDARSGDYKGLAFYFVVTVAAWNGISGAFSRHYYHRSNLEQSVHGIDVIRWVTIVLLTVVLALSCSPAGRDTRWHVVDQPQRMDDPFFRLERAMGIWKSDLPRVKREAKKSWQRALGQYSLLLSLDYRPWYVLPLVSLGLVDATRQGWHKKAEEKAVLSDEVIVRVLSGFKESNGELGDGRSALPRNQLQLGISHEISWACAMPAHIDKILVWHIGTTIAMDGHPVPPAGDQRVAKTLSEYCAYLVAFVPDMLPGHGYDTQRAFDAVVAGARESLAECDTVSSRCEKLVMMGGNSAGTVLEMGGRLGRELRGVAPEARRWKLLADFWAEFVLFLAPSGNAEIHAEKLAAGGEFMTHLWALLTHAGILEQPSWTWTPPV